MDASWVDFLPGSWKRIPAEALADSAARRGIRLFETPQAVIRIRVAGDGPITIVFVPDPPNVIEHYDGLFNLVTPWARAVCMEMPGFGFSRPKLGFRFTLAEGTQVVRSVLTGLGFGSYILAFSCTSAYVALKLAAECPDLVEKLLLIQAPSWSEEVKWAKRIDFDRGFLATPYFGQILMHLGKRMIARNWYQFAVANAAAIPSFVNPALQAIAHGGTFSLASGLQGFFKRAAPEFAEISQPALVLWGDADRTHRRTEKRSILDYVPHAQWEEFEDGGHFPELEQAERFVKVLYRFAMVGREA